MTPLTPFLVIVLCILAVCLAFMSHRRRVLERDSWRLRGNRYWSPRTRDQDMS